MNRASSAIASALSVMSSTSRLNSNSRASSSRRARASSARALAEDDRWLATRLTARKTNNANQFCGSAITNVPTGGKKKKFKHSIAKNDVATAVHRRVVVATIKTTSRYVSATVVAFDAFSHVT